MKAFDLILRFRVWILAAALAAWGYGAYRATHLQFNYSFWTLFVSDDPEVLNFERYRDTWGEDGALLFVALRARSGNVFTPEAMQVVHQLEQQLEALPGVEEVSSILSAPSIRGVDDELLIGPLAQGPPSTQREARALERLARDAHLLRGVLLSENHRTTAIAVRINEELRDAVDRNPVVVATTRLAREATSGSDLTPHVVGIPVAQWAYSDKMVRDMNLFLVVSFLLLAVILAVMFRSLAGMVLPLVVVGSATTWAVAFMELTGEAVNIMNSAIPTLMLVIGIADGIHLLAHFRQAVAAGVERAEAVRAALRHLGWACVLTSVTTMVGFASLATARIQTVKNFGLYSAVGIGFAMVANLVFIPIGLSYLKKTTLGARRVNYDQGWLSRLLAWMASAATHRPWRVLASSGAVVLLAAYGATLVRVESRIYEELADDDPVVLDNRAVEEDLPGIVSYALDITTPEGRADDPDVLAGIARLERLAESHPAVDRAFSITDVLRAMHRASNGGLPAFERLPDSAALVAQYLLLAEGDLTERLINPERSRLQLWMRGPEVVTSVWEDLRTRLEAEAKTLPPDVGVVVTGSSSMAQRALSVIVQDILTSLLGATVIIFCVMSVLFRSLRMGLLSMVPNLLPLLITVGFMGVAGIHLRTSTVVIFSISLGLAVDDTIHFLVRFRREMAAHRGDVVEAIRTTVRWTGRPIVYTSLLLIGGFWVLILSSFNAIRDVGLLGGVTLISALFADLWLLPALLRLLPSVAKSSTERVAAAPASATLS